MKHKYYRGTNRDDLVYCFAPNGKGRSLFAPFGGVVGLLWFIHEMPHLVRNQRIGIPCSQKEAEKIVGRKFLRSAVKQIR